MAKSAVIRLKEAPTFERGNGIVTTLLVCKDRCGAKNFTSGMTKFPAATAVPLHSHNCDEHVTMLEGKADVEIDGEHNLVERQNTVFIPEGTPHRFVNAGPGPMTILWDYGTDRVTRIFTETGETVEHHSAGDKTDGQSDGK